MDIRELKTMDSVQLVKVAAGLRVDNAGALRRPELLFRILQAQGQRNGTIVTEGVLEKLPDGYGFLRAADASYLPGPDDVYVAAAQIRRFGLQTGEAIVGQGRPPRHGERYFALSRLDSVNTLPPEQIRIRKSFDNLTPPHQPR